MAIEDGEYHAQRDQDHESVALGRGRRAHMSHSTCMLIGAYQNCPRQDLPSHARESHPPKFQVPLQFRWYQVNTLHGLIFTLIMYGFRPGRLEEIIFIPAAIILPYFQPISCRPRLRFRAPIFLPYNALSRIHHLPNAILCFIILSGYVVGIK